MRAVANNFDFEFFRKFPCVVHDQEGNKLTQFREYLQREGRLREARAILDQELLLYESGLAKEKACRSLLEACSVCEKLEPIWWIAGKVRIRLSSVLKALGQSELAKQELACAAKLFQQAYASGINNRTVLLVRLTELMDLSHADKTQELQRWVTFSEDPEVKADNQILSTALRAASNVALAILEASPSSRNRKIFWQWCEKAESMIENLGEVLTLYTARQVTGDIAAARFDDYGAILAWHRRFDAKYPAYNLWSPRLSSRRIKLLIHSGLGDDDAILQTILEIKEIVEDQDEFWSEEGFKIADQIAQAKQVEDKDDSGLQSTGSYTGNPHMEWLTGFSKEVPAFFPGSQAYRTEQGSAAITSSIMLEQTLLPWMRQASTEGVLSEEDLRNILLDPRTDQTIDVSVVLDSLTPQTLSVRLFGNYNAPTSVLDWERVYLSFSEWLLKKSKEPESKRHLLLYNLQYQRQTQSRLQGSRWWETVAIEAQRLLDLIPKLNEGVQQQVKSSAAPCRDTLASAKRHIYVEKTGHEVSDINSPEYVDIFSLYGRSLAENREHGRNRAVGYTLMNMARLFFFAALGLDMSVLEPFMQTLNAAQDAFERTREGWRVLQGWDRVRKVMLALEDDFMLQVVPWQLTFLSQLPRPLEIWTMIQRAKSTGLEWLMKVNEPPPREFEETTPLSSQAVQALKGQDDAVFVDWYNCSSSIYTPPGPIMAVVVQGKTPIFLKPRITWHEIDGIAREFFKCDTADLDSGKSLTTLYKLNPLVEELASLSKPGQTLVFSPFGNLHRLPLHALQCDGQTLIRRNPVVYCSSLGVLTAAFHARRACEQTFFQDRRRLQASVFGNPPSDEGKSALKSVGQMLGAKPIVKDRFRASRFTEAIQKPGLNLIHFHGDAEFSATAALNQSLVFKDRTLGMREIYEIPAARHRAHHVTLLGRGSGMSKSTAGNELVGLVPSLFHAGASSIVSTLWPSSDPDAALYSRWFYEEFEGAMSDDEDEVGVVNLAVANQKAVVKMMERRPAVKHWASFVLNGDWMLCTRSATGS